MIYSKLELVTKECSDCSSGREAIKFFKDSFTEEQAISEFSKSPEYDPNKQYVIRNPDYSIVYQFFEIKP